MVHWFGGHLIFVKAMSYVDLSTKFFEFCFELLSKCQGLALKLWANQECKAMFQQGLNSMYQIVTAESHLSQGLSWELKVTAQESQKIVSART